MKRQCSDHRGGLSSWQRREGRNSGHDPLSGGERLDAQRDCARAHTIGRVLLRARNFCARTRPWACALAHSRPRSRTVGRGRGACDILHCRPATEASRPTASRSRRRSPRECRRVTLLGPAPGLSDRWGRSTDTDDLTGCLLRPVVTRPAPAQPARSSARRAGCGLDERPPAPPLARHVVRQPGRRWRGAAPGAVRWFRNPSRAGPLSARSPAFRDCRPANKNARNSTHQESAGIRIDFSAEPLKAHWGPAGCPSEASTAAWRRATGNGGERNRRVDDARRRGAQRGPPRCRRARCGAPPRVDLELNAATRTRTVHFRRWRIRHRQRGSPAGRRSDPPMPRSQRPQFSVEMENRPGTDLRHRLQTEILANCRSHSRVARRLPMPRRRQRHFGNA